MAKQPPNKFLRILIPTAVILAAAAFFTFTIIQGQRQATPPTPAPPAPTVEAPTPEAPPAEVAEEPPAAPEVVGIDPVPELPPELPPPHDPAAPAVRLTDLRAEPLQPGRDTLEFTPIGSMDRDGVMTMLIEFRPLGAGVGAITLAQHFETIDRTDHVVVQHEYTYTPRPTAEQPEPWTHVVTPYAVLDVEINGQMVPVRGAFEDPIHGWAADPVWREIEPGQFEAYIINGDEQRIARLIRQYRVEPGSYVVRLNQWVQNLTSEPLEVRWRQFGPVDLDRDVIAYGGDRRRVRFGYLHRPEEQRGDPTVAASEFIWDRTPMMCGFLWARDRLLGPRDGRVQQYETVREIWPNERSVDRGYRIVWTGKSNRYFGAALFPPLTGEVHPDQKVFRAAATVDRILMQRWRFNNGGGYDPVMVLRTTSEPITVQPQGSANVSMSLYCGPLSRGLIGRHPSAAAAGLRDLVVYNFGGPCAPCTFGFLTAGLLNLLLFLHQYIVFDWALAIVVLVLIVRTCLHPVTRWSQIRLQRFGKQMSDMAPKQKKLQEKYKDDPKRMTEEMRKLWREEGINPAGMLGCVPLLLQAPIWIALFAMLFFAFELRHEAALFGIFQAITGGAWSFLADLAEPDRFIYFQRDLFTIPLLGPIRSINVLPLLLGVVFYVQQKYLTPPTTATLTPEQQQQQRMIKIMMVVLFPVIMYNAPSGLALYFIVNSSLAIVESKWIRKHIEKHGLLEVKKTPRKPGGFMDRLQRLAEERQREVAKRSGRGGKGGQQPPRKRV